MKRTTVKYGDPKKVRAMIRKGGWKKPTAGLAPGYAQANLVVLPQRYAFDFLLFCQRNPKPCPLLEVLEPGRAATIFLSSEADIRTDLPLYNIYRKGKLEEAVPGIKKLWQEDFITFLIGCSYSFEEALIRAGIPVRHIEEGKNVPMYITDIPCNAAGIFKGTLVVTMRPMPPERVVPAVRITSRYTSVHGGPVHIGNPAAIGVRNIGRPDFGEAVTIKKGEVPLFWACGVTPQVAVMKAKPDICITHAPGHMFISDVLNEELANR
ncbi:MAG: putative hydro-lyase [Syntrophorhabdaceae bacterium]|nr:putative hydro-lyase [Syntrophorhabdaceae bacterium]